MRKCRLCHASLPESDFSPHPQSAGGINTRCKRCRVVVEGIRRYRTTENFLFRMKAKIDALEEDKEQITKRQDYVRGLIEHLGVMQSECK